MTIAWKNNPRGICEDAPCCGCCGPQGDGVFYPDEPPDPDDFHDPHDRWDSDHYDDPTCDWCGVETTYGSTMQGNREVWYCERCGAPEGE